MELFSDISKPLGRVIHVTNSIKLNDDERRYLEVIVKSDAFILRKHDKSKLF